MMVRYSAGMFIRISSTEETKYIPYKRERGKKLVSSYVTNKNVIMRTIIWASSNTMTFEDLLDEIA